MNNDPFLAPKFNNDHSASNTLMSAFINSVEAQRGKEIPEQDAMDLIARARAFAAIVKFSTGK